MYYRVRKFPLKSVNFLNKKGLTYSLNALDWNLILKSEN